MFIRHHHNSIRHHQGDNTKDAIARDVGGCRYSSCDWCAHGILYRDRNTPIRPVSPSNSLGCWRPPRMPLLVRWRSCRFFPNP